MGLHGEPGVSRGALRTADEIVDAMLEKVIADLPFRPGDPVCLLVNDLGSTTWMELLIAARRAHQVLRSKGLRAYDTVIGSFCTCQEMAGLSLSLMKLDEELLPYYDAPARSLAWCRG
jgi:dihydroxyacetone kinase-like protein